LPQGKCIAHALALIVKHTFQCFPFAKELLLDAGAIISAGGGAKRRTELVNDYGLNPNAMIAYTNRFADVTKKAKYRLDNFQKVAEWHTTGSTLPREDDSDDEDDDGGDNVATKCSRAKAAYAMPNKAKLSLAGHVALLGDIPQLVADSSAEFDGVPYDFVVRLNSLKDKLIANSNSNGATRSVRQLLVKSFAHLSSEQQEAAVVDFTPTLVAAAKKGLASYYKHISPNLNKYVLRMRYSILNEPDGSDDPFDHTYNAGFFGCAADDFGNDICIQWSAYRKEWKKRTLANPHWQEGTTSYEFWDTTKKLWPLISNEAKWYNNWPTSSVAAERSFALARVVDSPRRGRMSWETFSIELRLKCNQFILAELLNERVEEMQQYRGER
jgi:hypothetical protein